MRTIGGGRRYPLLSTVEASAPRSAIGNRTIGGGAVYTLRVTAAMGTPVSRIVLVHTKLSGYSAYTATWDNLYVKRRR